MPLDTLTNILMQLAPSQYGTTLPGLSDRLAKLAAQADESTSTNRPPVERPEPGARGAAYVGEMKSMLGGRDTGRLSELEDEYNEWTQDPDQRQSGWRMAAAIGTSMLKPLREGGVPGMLATSPKQREWEQRGSLLSKRLEAENARELERLKQTGPVMTKVAEQAAPLYQMSASDGAIMDPFLNDIKMKLGEGDMIAERGDDGRMGAGVKNNKPTILKQGDTAFGLDQDNPSAAKFGAPAVQGDTVVRPDTGAVSITPGKQLEEETNKFGHEADLEGDKARAAAMGEVARINGASSETVARIDGAAQIISSMFGANRGSGGGSGRAAAAAAKAAADFQSDAHQILNNVFQSEGFKEGRVGSNRAPMEAQLERMVGELNNAWKVATIGMPDAPPEPSWQAILSQASTQMGNGEAGFDPEALTRMFNEAVAEGIENIAIQAQGGGPAPTAASSTSSVTPTSDDVEVHPDGSVTVGGVTYTAEMVQEAAAAAGVSPEEYIKGL